MRDKQTKKNMMMGKSDNKNVAAGRFDPIVLL